MNRIRCRVLFLALNAALAAFLGCSSSEDIKLRYPGFSYLAMNECGHREFRLIKIPSMVFVEIKGEAIDGAGGENFLIGKHEVTIGQFMDYCRQSGQQVDPEDLRLYEPRDPNMPIFHVNWKDSVEFCNYFGIRLPTEKEWEAAAVDKDQKYTWGDDFDQSKVNTRGKDDGFEFAAPVETFKSGASYSGTVSMCGNVWEWISDHGQGKDRICKGGSYSSGESTCTVKHRIVLGILDRNHRIGFRPAMSGLRQ